MSQRIVHCFMSCVIWNLHWWTAHQSNLKTYSLWIQTEPWHRRTNQKNICYAKGEAAVDHNTATRWLKKFCSGCKYESAYNCGFWYSLCSTQKVSGKFGISQFSVVRHFHNFGKSKLCVMLAKSCKTFDSLL